jgi:hypothetical protein
VWQTDVRKTQKSFRISSGLFAGRWIFSVIVQPQ